MHMQTSSKCQWPEHEYQDSIASLRTGGNPATPPMQLLSMHVQQKAICFKDGMGASGHGGGNNPALSHSQQVLRLLLTQIRFGRSIGHSQTYRGNFLERTGGCLAGVATLRSATASRCCSSATISCCRSSAASASSARCASALFSSCSALRCFRNCAEPTSCRGFRC